MQYLNIVTWEPDQRDDVLKRFAAQGPGLPAGMKMLGLWADVCGGRVFQLVDTGDVRDPYLVVQTNHAWSDLCKIESISVMNADEMMKIVSDKK